MRQIKPPNSQRRAPLPRGLHDPVAVERQRRNAGQTAAARAAVRPGRPADDADDGRAALADPRTPARRNPRCRRQARRARPASADRPAGSAVFRAGRSRPDRRARTIPPLLPSPRIGHADAGDGEAAARRQSGSGHAELAGFFPLSGVSSCSSATSAVARWASIACMLKPGWMATVLTSRSCGCLVGAIFDDLVDRAGLHAMRHRQHQPRCNQGAGAEIAARADDGDDGAADALGRRHPAADDRVRGRGEQQRQPAIMAAGISSDGKEAGRSSSGPVTHRARHIPAA